METMLHRRTREDLRLIAIVDGISGPTLAAVAVASLAIVGRRYGVRRARRRNCAALVVAARCVERMIVELS